MSCLGACTLPTTVPNYDSSSTLWMLRAYNGTVYHSTRVKTLEKFHPGDKAKIEYDATKGTLRYFKNGTDLGIAFDDIPPGTLLYPAVSL